MQTKLTLRLDDELVRKAKKFSKRAGKSVSKIVADYFDKLEVVAPVDKTALECALKLPFKDFEYDVLHESVRLVHADAIVTRNTADFKHSSIPVRLPGKLK
jgi:hypothetical protein